MPIAGRLSSQEYYDLLLPEARLDEVTGRYSIRYKVKEQGPKEPLTEYWVFIDHISGILANQDPIPPQWTAFVDELLEDEIIPPFGV